MKTRFSSIESQPKKVVVLVVYCCSFCCYCYYFKFSQHWVSNSWDIFPVVIAFVLLWLMLLMTMMMLFLLLFSPETFHKKSGQNRVSDRWNFTLIDIWNLLFVYMLKGVDKKKLTFEFLFCSYLSFYTSYL